MTQVAHLIFSPYNNKHSIIYCENLSLTLIAEG